MTISSTTSETSHPSAAVVPNLGGGGQSEVVFVKCDCCGLTEECTETYIAKVRERYQGRWICGLCAEAVKDEIFRSASADHETNNTAMISTEEALNRHMNFFKKFRSSSTQHPPPNPTKHLISAMKQLLKRSLTTIGSTPTSPHPHPHPHPPRPKEIITEPARSLSRSESCFSTLAS